MNLGVTRITAALVMEGFAKHSGLNPRALYHGILHAIGRVLINASSKQKGFTIFWDVSKPMRNGKKTLWDIVRRSPVRCCLEHWHFPSPTCEAIRWQLNSEKVIDPVSLLGALPVYPSLLALTGLEFENQGWQFPATHPYVQASGLTPEKQANSFQTAGPTSKHPAID